MEEAQAPPKRARRLSARGVEAAATASACAKTAAEREKYVKKGAKDAKRKGERDQAKKKEDAEKFKAEWNAWSLEGWEGEVYTVSERAQTVDAIASAMVVEARRTTGDWKSDESRRAEERRVRTELVTLNELRSRDRGPTGEKGPIGVGFQLRSPSVQVDRQLGTRSAAELEAARVRLMLETHAENIKARAKATVERSRKQIDPPLPDKRQRVAPGVVYSPEGWRPAQEIGTHDVQRDVQRDLARRPAREPSRLPVSIVRDYLPNNIKPTAPDVVRAVKREQGVSIKYVDKSLIGAPPATHRLTVGARQQADMRKRRNNDQGRGGHWTHNIITDKGEDVVDAAIAYTEEHLGTAAIGARTLPPSCT